MLAQAANNLAWFYQRRGRLADLTEAERLYRSALDISEKALGSKHATVGAMLNNLAVLSYDQGRYAEAEPLFKRAIAVRQGALGAEHSDVGQTKYRLARLYAKQRRFAEARGLHQRALEIRHKALGEEHPDVAESFDGIAQMYEAQGDWARAAGAARSAGRIVVRPRAKRDFGRRVGKRGAARLPRVARCSCV